MRYWEELKFTNGMTGDVARRTFVGYNYLQHGGALGDISHCCNNGFIWWCIRNRIYWYVIYIIKVNLSGFMQMRCYWSMSTTELHLIYANEMQLKCVSNGVAPNLCKWDATFKCVISGVTSCLYKWGATQVCQKLSCILFWQMRCKSGVSALDLHLVYANEMQIRCVSFGVTSCLHWNWTELHYINGLVKD